LKWLAFWLSVKKNKFFQKTLDFLKKGVDNQKQVWYYNKAVSERQARQTKLQKSLKKCLTS